MAKFEDLTGMQFGELKVVALHTKEPRTQWLTRCSKGTERISTAYKLKSGRTYKCVGCDCNPTTPEIKKKPTKSKKEVEKEFKRLGWNLISGEYITSDSKFQIECAKCKSQKELVWYRREANSNCVICYYDSMIDDLYQRILEKASSINVSVLTPREEFQNERTMLQLKCKATNQLYQTRWVTLKNSDKAMIDLVGQSHMEKEIVTWLIKEGYEVKENIKLVNGQEVDILVGKIGIELHGLYWHSHEKKGSTYHWKKFKIAQSQDIQLIQIWEDEWLEKQNIVKSIILQKLGNFSIKRIFGRKTEIKEVSFRECSSFLNDHHLQGTTNFFKSWGLYYLDELVMVATLSHHHRGGETKVLSRVCTKQMTSVVGGLSKLLKKFPTPLISWSDNRISWGNAYEKLGFVNDGELRPDYQYFKGKKRFGKQLFRKTVEERKTDKTEYELRKEQGYERIYDAGKIRWLKT